MRKLKYRKMIFRNCHLIVRVKWESDTMSKAFPDENAEVIEELFKCGKN